MKPKLVIGFVIAILFVSSCGGGGTYTRQQATWHNDNVTQQQANQDDYACKALCDQSSYARRDVFTPYSSGECETYCMQKKGYQWY